MANQTVDEIVELLAPLRVEDGLAGTVVRAAPDAYRAMSHDVLRQSHAHEAAERATASASFVQDDRAMHLWTRRGPGDAAWVALALSVTRNRSGSVLNAGYRVIADGPEEAAALAADPARALATLVTRFGVSFYTGRKRVYLMPEHLVEIEGRLDALGPDQFARAVGLETPPDGSKV
ncbi:MAG: hypothetical protein JHC74_06655, partial [Thermoleophilia bacterium]|nr:hypothetical protein [Thermoleophilia bacterium]